MPSGPKKRRAAAKKKEQPQKSNVVEVEDVINNQEALPVSVAEVVVHNPVYNVVEDVVVDEVREKAGSAGFFSGSVVISIEPEQITDDKSVDESNRASNEPVKSILDEIDHESYQSVEKGVSELLASDLLTSNEQVKNTMDKSVHETNQAVEKAESESLASDVIDHESNHEAEKAESEMLASDLLMNNEEVKRTTDDVDHQSNQTVAKAGSEMVASVFLSSRNDPVMNTTDEVIESIQAADKAGSEMVASDLLMNNEEVKHTTDDVDQESNQTVGKAGSEMVASVFLTASNDPVMNTTDKVIESIHAVDKAGLEMVALDLLTVVQDHHASVLMEEISVGEENVSNEVIAQRMDVTDHVSGVMQEISVASEDRDEINPATEIIHVIAENKMDGPNDPDTDYESLNKLKSDFQPLLQEGGVCSCNMCSLVCNLSEIKNIKCCHLGETIGSSSQVKRVKEILENELMETEKLRLVLKKALDDLYEAAA